MEELTWVFLTLSVPYLAKEAKLVQVNPFHQEHAAIPAVEIKQSLLLLSHSLSAATV
jgi:hypothetical protein